MNNLAVTLVFLRYFVDKGAALQETFGILLEVEKNC